MNAGTTLEVAVAATLMSLTTGVAAGPPLTALAAVSAVGVLLALKLPGRTHIRTASLVPPEDAARAGTRP
ncbi:MULTISPECIES: hypothetical protein [Streptomyces]|uniref:hypothetical protein n=1 Tax=Streptomyces TaxID=1883 RepID=UPI00142E1ADB|nr:MULTISPECIES: hypothetical protein [Streptomyces]